MSLTDRHATRPGRPGARVVLFLSACALAVAAGAASAAWAAQTAGACGDCHSPASAGYPVTVRQPAGSAEAGYPGSGTYPGRAVFESSAHSRGTVKRPGSDAAAGSCMTCHVADGHDCSGCHYLPGGTTTPQFNDRLQERLSSPKTFNASTTAEAFAACMATCHDADGPGPDVASAIAAGRGHRIGRSPRVVAETSAGYLPDGVLVPCWECHNPHGNGSGSIVLLPDELSSAAVTSTRGVCEACHRPAGSAAETPVVAGMALMPLRATAAAHSQGQTTPCTTCHGSGHAPHAHGGGASGTGCEGCHGSSGSHAVHIDPADPRGPGGLACADCHDEAAFPAFASGTDSDANGRIDLSETDVCDTCHSPAGGYDGVDTTTTAEGTSVGARTNWAAGVYETTSTLKPGKERWCVGCHDRAPAVVGGRTAPNKTGDGATFGFYVTGHGAESTYAAMTWQADGAAGNPGASRECLDCHAGTGTHIADGDQDRLRPGMENDQTDSNCSACHVAGMADAAPSWYTTISAYEASAHSELLCTACHDVHGGSSGTTAMTTAAREDLCYSCHTDAGVKNDAVSGAALADDIEQSFGMSETHAMGAAFTANGVPYTLRCTSCHNVHVITGRYWEATAGLTPVTRFSANTQPWGDSAGERMSAYAGSGTYRTPASDAFSGTQLPDYVTFCLDCHGPAMPSPPVGAGGISWGGDEPHGQNSANVPNGGGTTPDWFACGQAFGWDGDDRTGPESLTWPVIPRGYGEQLFSRDPYNTRERIGGANFVLSCTDCHEAHGSNVRSMLRSNPNGGSGTTIWNTMCNNCHYYYSDWHAGMACGDASCHISTRMEDTGIPTLHDMGSRTGAGSVRTLDTSVVARFAFENNLNDSGGWRMHATWRNDSGTTTGTFATGRTGTGKSLEVTNSPVEIGTRNAYWSTDEGRHGTWKYTEMKYEMTLEAWVRPSSLKNESIIMAKHTYTDGGYNFHLKLVDGTLRAALLANVTGGGPTWPGWDSADCNGLRGAYSSVPLPLNEWSHVAVTYDADGEDRDDDPSEGRIRVWVNGDDVTWSNPSVSGECYTQPGAGEDTMFPMSMHSPDNEGICYDGQWCGSSLFLAGFPWSPASNFAGRIDDAVIHNTVRGESYFASVDASTAPRLATASGAGATVTVGFTEGVYASAGATGALGPEDLVLADTGGNNPRTIVSVAHAAGSPTATVLMSAPMVAADFNADTLRFAAGGAFDDNGGAASTATVAISKGACPSGDVLIRFEEASGTAIVTDDQAVLDGVVSDAAQTLGGGYLNGDGVNNYVDFENNLACLTADRAMALEYRIRPEGIPNDTSTAYIKRVVARDGGGNYQSSVWRNPTWAAFKPPAGVASIAFWVNPADAHGGNSWKIAVTDYERYPVVSDHWYRVKIVWDSAKTGGIPAEIYLDDQGTDGAGAGEAWAGFVESTNTSQSLVPTASQLFEGDSINVAQGPFTIGANVGDHTQNVFAGKIDWVAWSPSANRTLAPENTEAAGMGAPGSATGGGAKARTPAAGLLGSRRAARRAADAALGRAPGRPRSPAQAPAATFGAAALLGGLALLRRSLKALRFLVRL